MGTGTNGTAGMHGNKLLSPCIVNMHLISTATYTNRAMGITPEPEGIDFRSTSYVYCDLLEHILVGDVIVPLLRIVNLDEKMKEYSNMHRITKRVLFVPVQKKHFDTIEIQILKLLLKLHIYRR